MNANELANKLDEIYTGTDYAEIKQASTMLRQQAQEIEALKSATIPYKDLRKVVTNVLAQPMRELTEDEIREVADSVCHTWKKNGVGELYMTDFAKALLKKATEK